MAVISQRSVFVTRNFRQGLVVMILLSLSGENLTAQDHTSPPKDEQISARLNGSAWDPKVSGTGPVLLVPDDQAAVLKMSLSRLSAHQQRKELNKFSKAQAATPYKLIMPKPQPNPSRTIDVWSRTKVDSSAMGTPTPGYDGHIGADMKLNRNLLLGTSTQLTEKQNADGTRDESYLTGPYLAMQLSPNLKFDAETAWGEQQNTSLQDTPTTQKRTSSAKLSGHWKRNSFTLAPSAAIIHDKVASHSNPSDAAKAGTTTQITRLNVRPELRRPFQLDSGELIEPFVNLSGSLDLDANKTNNNASNLDTIGAGVSLSKPSKYNVRATTGIEGLGTDNEPEVKGRLNLTVPIQ